MSKPDPQPGQLVRVTCRVHSGSPERQFVALVTRVLPPGEGPIIRKPGKRVGVAPLPGAAPDSLAGWYSLRELVVIGWHSHVLSTGQMLLLDGMAAWYALGHDAQDYQAARGVWGMLAKLERRGLVTAVQRDSSGWVSARITEAGLETVASYRQSAASR